MSVAKRHSVTYFPVDTQRQYALNREQIRGRTYERYLIGDLRSGATGAIAHTRGSGYCRSCVLSPRANA